MKKNQDYQSLYLKSKNKYLKLKGGAWLYGNTIDTNEDNNQEYKQNIEGTYSYIKYIEQNSKYIKDIIDDKKVHSVYKEIHGVRTLTPDGILNVCDFINSSYLAKFQTDYKETKKIEIKSYIIYLDIDSIIKLEKHQCIKKILEEILEDENKKTKKNTIKIQNLEETIKQLSNEITKKDIQRQENAIANIHIL